MIQGRLSTPQLAEARQLGQHVQATVMPHVEQLLLADFPLRSGSAVDALNLSTSFKLDEISVSLKVNCLDWYVTAQQHGLCWHIHGVQVLKQIKPSLQGKQHSR